MLTGPPHRSGVNMLDTAWIYQNQAPDGVTHYNESLVGRALKKFGRENFGARRWTAEASVFLS